MDDISNNLENSNELKSLYRIELMQAWAEKNDCVFMKIPINNFYDIQETRNSFLKIIDS
jgi:hypothetical protein